MALALDASSPTRVTGTANPATTGAFSPPASTLIIALVSADSSNTFALSGGGLTWSQIGIRNDGSTCAVAAFWAWNANAQTNITVSATRTGSFTALELRVLVFTGAESSFGGATSNAAALTTSVTTTRANSWVWAIGASENGDTAASAAANCTIQDAYTSFGGVSGGVIKQTSPTAASGTAFTIGVSGVTLPSILAIEVREAAAATVDPGLPALALPPGLFSGPASRPQAWSGTGGDLTEPATDTVACVAGSCTGLAGAVADSGTGTVAPGPAGPSDGLGGGQALTGAATVTTATAGRAGGSSGAQSVAQAEFPGPAGPADGLGGTASATGAAAIAAAPAGARGLPGTTTASGAATVTATPASAVGLPGAVSATATTLQATQPAGAQGRGGVVTATGTASSSTTPTGAAALPGGQTTIGAASIATTAAGAQGLPGTVTAAATTLQATAPAGALGGARTTAATGTASTGSTPAAAVALPGGVTATGTATTTSTPAAALAGGPASVSATATTLQATVPGAGARGAAGALALSAAGAVLPLPGLVLASGGPVGLAGTTSTAALPGRAFAGAGVALTGLPAFALPGGGLARGGGQGISVLLVTRGSMTPAARGDADIQPAERSAADLVSVNRFPWRDTL